MVPKHIAIIMDGNGRWAKAHHLPRTIGHKEGIERVKEIIGACRDWGIKALTLFAFSTENWNRPKQEIDVLMNYLDDFLKHNIDKLDEKDIKLQVMGRPDRIPPHLKERIGRAISRTAENTGLILNLALDYGGRYDIVNAVKIIINNAKKDTNFNPDIIDEEYFSRYLLSHGLPEPDLLIRTSGEERISNFMLWQLSYAELYFSKKFWPDFRREDFKEAIEVFNQRQRRFGGIK